MSAYTATRQGEIAQMLAMAIPPPLERLFRVVREGGLRVSNLCHRSDGQWQCSLRKRDHSEFFEFAYGPSAPDAVLHALQKASDGKTTRAPALGDDDVDPAHVEPSPASPEDDLIG
jgi:hypothetical protein